MKFTIPMKWLSLPPTWLEVWQEHDEIQRLLDTGEWRDLPTVTIAWPAASPPPTPTGAVAPCVRSRTPPAVPWR